jgi:hypothetical protein
MDEAAFVNAARQCEPPFLSGCLALWIFRWFYSSYLPIQDLSRHHDGYS